MPLQDGVDAYMLCHLSHCLGTFPVVGKATECPVMVVYNPSSYFKVCRGLGLSEKKVSVLNPFP